LSERGPREAVEVLIARLPHAADLPLPTPATAGSAGYDLASAEDGELAPFERRLFKTGLSIAVPDGYECQLRPSTPATIDSDYRGELMVALVNLGTATFQVSRGMRIAQMIIARVERVVFQPVEVLPSTARGTGGFGSSGA
jgi:dUTP pyrophosphatase